MNDKKNPVVLLSTNYGDIKIELYPEKAPVTVKNFLDYVASGQFNHTIFHRVIDGFMIQGGGFTKDFDQKPTKAPIQNEANNSLKNVRGSIAMARTSDINSATSQFFINVADNDFLDFRDTSDQGFGYCVFGQTIEGLDVIDKIRKVKTGSNGMHRDVPKETIEILSSSVI